MVSRKNDTRRSKAIRTLKRKAEAPCSAPTGKCSLARKVRLLTFIAEGYLTRGARRWSWTILKVEFNTFLKCKKDSFPIWVLAVFFH